MVERVRERVRPQAKADRESSSRGCDACDGAEGPVPPRQLDDRCARFRAGALDDPVAQLFTRDRPFGRVRQGRDGLAKQRKLLGALRAVRKMPLEALALVVVERVERVGG